MGWFKVDTELLRNDRVLMAIDEIDHGVIPVFLELLASNARAGSERDGILPARKASVSYLAMLLAGTGISKEKLPGYLAALQVSGLVKIHPSGDLEILGWDDYWRPPMTGAERASRRRIKKAATESRPERDGVTDHVTMRQIGRERERQGPAPKGGLFSEFGLVPKDHHFSHQDLEIVKEARRAILADNPDAEITPRALLEAYDAQVRALYRRTIADETIKLEDIPEHYRNHQVEQA